MDLQNKNTIVSIITPVYNSERFLKKCMDSVLTQTYLSWEHILIDDCSTDESPIIIKKYQKKDSRIKYVRLKENSGAGIARNRGIEMAKGRYIAFLDSDDFWALDKLEKQINFMRNMNYCFVYSQYYVVKADGKPVYKIESPEKVSYIRMIKNNYIGCLTVVYDTNVLGKIFMPLIRKRQDWVLWIKLLKKTKYAYGFQEPLAFYRIGNASLSNSKIKLLKHNFDVYYVELNMSFLKSTIMMGNFLLHYFYYKIISKKQL